MEESADELKQMLGSLEAQHLKLRQDFKAYIEATQRNEQRKRLEMRVQYASKLLPVIDALDRAQNVDLNGECKAVRKFSENMKKNMEIVYSQLITASGLTSIDPAHGDKFDAQRHTAIGAADSSQSNNVIASVVRRGYALDGIIVRPAEVTVSQAVERPSIWRRLIQLIFPFEWRIAELERRIEKLEQGDGNIEKEIGVLHKKIDDLRAAIERDFNEVDGKEGDVDEKFESED